MYPKITVKTIFINLLGSAILAFGTYHVHSQSAITEGGMLGLTLLVQYWLHISPAVSGIVMSSACFYFAWRVLGGRFIVMSLVAGGGFSLFYAIFEQFPPLFPRIAEYPLIAAIAGALFVGIGAGLSVRVGGASGGDDALAMGLNKLTGVKISTVYLVSDLAVLLLSLTYIPPRRIMYSLLTVVLSGQIIGFIGKNKASAD